MDLKEELFHKTIGCVVANNIASMYNGWMSEIFKDAGQNYLHNKCHDAFKYGEKVLKALKVADAGIRKGIEHQVQFNSDIIYDITAMDLKDQKRVQSLINKIKRERSNEHS